MSTELQEKGAVKCERYFPDEGEVMESAGITISFVDKEQKRGYVVTQLEMEKDGLSSGIKLNCFCDV